MVEHSLGKGEVARSIRVGSTSPPPILLIYPDVCPRLNTVRTPPLFSVKFIYSLRKSEMFLMALVAAYTLAGYLTAVYLGHADLFKPFMYADATALSTVAFVIGYLLYRLLRFYYIVIFIRPPRLAAYLKADFLAGPLNKERYKRAVPVFFSMLVLFSVFTSLKNLIPVIQPFQWDPFWADVDRALHFGADPWRWLQPLLGYPDVTKSINVIYNFWLPVKYFVLYWMMMSLKDPFRRMQFFVACALTWIINGTILATIFSAAGPCFYFPITGVDRFGELMTYLKNVDPENQIWALRMQAILWERYTSGTLDFGSGISAMPSLHVASAFLLMLAGWRSHFIFRAAGALFYLSILIGSVHLGWHYAVDGYLSTVITLALWIVSGKLVGKLDGVAEYGHTEVHENSNEQ